MVSGWGVGATFAWGSLILNPKSSSGCGHAQFTGFRNEGITAPARLHQPSDCSVISGFRSLPTAEMATASALMSTLLASESADEVLTQLEAIFGALVASTIAYDDLKAALPGGETTFLSLIPMLKPICYGGADTPDGCQVNVWTNTVSQLILGLQMYSPPSSDKQWPRLRFTPAIDPKWPEWYMKMVET